MSKLGPKTQNYQFKLKSEYAEFNGDVHFFNFKPEISISGKSDVKNQNCQLKLKFDTCNYGHNFLRLHLTKFSFLHNETINSIEQDGGLFRRGKYENFNQRIISGGI